jgi:hypothetical protein
MTNKALLTPQLYFSYGQFMIYDLTTELPGCAWTAQHTAQGFARRETVACFNSILEYGHATVTVTRGEYVPHAKYMRVISVPFRVDSGKVLIEGPEEFGVGRAIDLNAGNYLLTAAQLIVGDDEELIDLFFASRAVTVDHSKIVVADDNLHPSSDLLETADAARF